MSRDIREEAALARAKLVDIVAHVRVMVAERRSPEAIEGWLDRQHGLMPLVRCPNAGHEDETRIDNCNTCAPRWGWVERESA